MNTWHSFLNSYYDDKRMKVLQAMNKISFTDNKLLNAFAYTYMKSPYFW